MSIWHVANTSAPRDESTTSARGVASESYKSEFLAAASGVDITELLNILDEHMNVVKVLHQREYESLIKMIKEKKSRYHNIPAFLMSSNIYADVIAIFIRPDKRFVIV